MKKIKVYLDTSVIGGCFDEEFSEYSTQLVDEIIVGKKLGVISDITVQELVPAPEKAKTYFEKIYKYLEVLQSDREIDELANLYLKERIVAEKYFEDLQHIAFATFYQIDVLTSWNFKHIVNFQKINLINSANIKLGYRPLAIYSPREVIENEK